MANAVKQQGKKRTPAATGKSVIISDALIEVKGYSADETKQLLHQAFTTNVKLLLIKRLSYVIAAFGLAYLGYPYASKAAPQLFKLFF